MDEIQLIAQKRAFPSRGRARIHEDALKELEIEEGASIDIGIIDAEKWISATAFADSLVTSGHIRLSEEDLKALGASEGSKLRVKKTPPMVDQIKSTVTGAGASVSAGLGKAGESIKGTSTESIKAGAAGAAASVSTGLGKAGHSVSAAFSSAFEAAKKKLKPADAMTLDKALKANNGEVRAVPVAAGSGTRALSSIILPKGVVLAAVQRGDTIQTTDPSFVLVSGDTVYLVGESSLLDEASKVIGG
ncbi:MAG: TrkA C-terminal domain-containing protein [Methanomicrobiales archaeon]